MNQDPSLSVHRLSMNPKKPTDLEWRRRYNAHLDSQEWQDLRNKVIDREEGICEGCRNAPIEHVHHLSYLNMGNEFLFELKGLCIDCHLRCHSDQKYK